MLVKRQMIYAAILASALLFWQGMQFTAGLNTAIPAISAAKTIATTSASHLTTAVIRIIPQQASLVSSLQVIVSRNDTLDGIFRRLALNPADLAAIRNLPGIRQSLDYLKPGDAISLTHQAAQVRSLTRRVSETQTLDVQRETTGFAAKIIENSLQSRVRTATATIHSSLFQSAESAAISDLIALKLSNIFAWDIDFVLDIRDGDQFTIVYNQVFQNDHYLRDGDLLAAEFVNAGKKYRAVRFIDDAGQIAYYTPDGQPLRKAFLRAPLEFSRISSSFNPHRLHPILNRIRGHMGTDYAAPKGTPVHAAGDGRVTFVGRRGGYGNAIMLTHADTVSTLYGHLARFAKGIHTGIHVQQGDTIGYVGMTGLATGPHLHYEYLRCGIHLNPQTVHLPGADPLSSVSLRNFNAQTSALIARLTPLAQLK